MSDLNKFTPGPWDVIHVTGNGLGGSYDHYEIRANCAALVVNYDRKNKNRHADMTLISAAPDLLDALEECLPCLGWKNMPDEEIQREHELGNGYAELILRARAAIAKARGQS